MENIQKTLYWAILVSEVGHVFCCVLPTIFSMLSLLAGLGLITTVPAFMVGFHDLFHDWELPVIAASGILLALGWALYAYSRKIDCHDTGCAHEPCGPRKNKAGLVLKIATILFIFNVSIYTGIHRNEASVQGAVEAHQDHHGHHGHHHHGHAH